MESQIANTSIPAARLDELRNVAEDVLVRARRRGAEQAEVGLSVDTGLAVNVRLGEVETVEHTRDRGLALTVYVKGRKATASTADLAPDSIDKTLEQALAIARYTEVDPCAGLADADRLAREPMDLDLWHPWDLDVATAIELARRCEQAGLDDPRIRNSEGASVHAGGSLSVYANSHGFNGADAGTRHSISCALIAGEGDAMQRDDWYTYARAAQDLAEPESVGRMAAQRTVSRVGARAIATCEVPVLYAPEVARGLIGHLLSAVSGGALYRKASFLLDKAGHRILPDWMNIREYPHLRRGLGSSWFDAEGVATIDQPLVTGGILNRYLLGSYSARKLGLASTGNAGGVHNIVVEPGEQDFAELLRSMGRGLLVTEVMGQGVSTVTGDYSRGASGYWVENGEIAWPVEEITIASNLARMFEGIQAVGRDVDLRSHILTGSILVDRMTVAGHVD